MADWVSPKVIYLQPWCADCEKNGGDEGRLWCEDDAWGKCEDCGKPSVKYARAAKQTGEG